MAKSFDEIANRLMTKKERAQAKVRAQEMLTTMFLREVRRMVGLNQSELAKRMGIRQSGISKLEANEQDMMVETLRRVVEALGGKLDIIARFPQCDVRLARSSDAKTTTENEKELQPA